MKVESAKQPLPSALIIEVADDILIDSEGVAEIGTWEWDVKNNFVIWSKCLYHIYGLNPDDYQPSYHALLERVHPEDQKHVAEALKRVYEEHIPFSHDERIFRPDGSIRFLHTWGHPYLDANGKVSRLVGVCQDITERKKTEQILRATIESTADGIIVIGLDEKILDYNHRFLELWRVPPGFLEGKGYRQALHYVEDQLVHGEECVRRMGEILADHASESHDVLQFKDGRIYERFSRPQRLGGKCIGRVFSYRDVSERIRFEERLQVHAERQNMVTEISRLITRARFNREKIIDCIVKRLAKYFNDGVIVRLFPGDRGEIETMSYFHSDESVMQLLRVSAVEKGDHCKIPALAEMLQTGRTLLLTGNEEIKKKISESYMELANRYGIHCWLNAPLRVAGHVIGTLSLFRFRNAPCFTSDEIEFIQEIADHAAIAVDNANLYAESQHAVELRDDFIAVASHELKTPLTSLKMQLQLLKERIRPVVKMPTLEPILKMLASSDQQIARLARLIDDMIDTSRLTTGRLALNLEKFDMNVLVKQLAKQFEDQLARAKCDLELTTSSPAFGNWDRMRIEQILTNLLTNAIKYGAGRPIQIKVSERQGFVYVSVRDFGIGIAKDDHERIFNRFERAVSSKSFGGLGIGLFISRQIADAHGGKLWVESSLGEGAVFHLELPVTAFPSSH
jgi:PAS domain S-box-containing protein